MPLAIDRWHHALHLAGPHREPQAVRDRVEGLAGACTSALGEALAPWLAAHPGERVRVRRLALRLALDVRRDPQAAAQALAAQLARCIVDGIEAGGPDVVRFASELDRIEAFALALAAGDAHSRWYFDDLAGLAPLPPGAALRTLVEGDPALAWPLLARLAAHPAALALVGEGDALRWLDVLIAQADTGATCAVAQLECWIPPRLAAPSARAVLALLARARSHGVPPAPALCAAALAAVLARGVPARAAPAGPARDAVGLLHGELAQRLAALGPLGRSAWREARELRAAGTPADGAAAVPVFDGPCAMAGLVMLLPELESLLESGLGAALPAIESGSARGAFSLAALALAGGDARAVWHDPAWRALLDVPPALCWSELAAAPVAPRAVARHLWRRVSQRVPGMLGASLPYLRRNLLAAGGHAVSDDGEHWRFRVPRGPLHVLLAMTSLSQRELRWSGPPARRISIGFA